MELKIEYPKWLYHATEDPCLVADPEAEAALGDGWQESPAHVKPPKKDKK